MPTNNIWKRKNTKVEFKERISKNTSNKYIFNPIKRKNDTVERTAKIKIDGRVKDIVEQKNILG